MKILILAFTVASWGGLHENVVSSIKGMIKSGHDVDAVLSKGKIAAKAEQLGADVVPVEWSQPIDYEEIRSKLNDRYDVIIATPQKSRELAIRFRSDYVAPLIIQFHGHYSDGAAFWKADVDFFTSVSGSISNLLTGYCGIEKWKVQELANGIDDSILSAPILDFDSKTKNSVVTISVASRLEEDKEFQWRALEQTLNSLTGVCPFDVEVKIMGDGGNRRKIEQRLQALPGVSDNVLLTFTGWLEPEQVIDELRRSFISVGAGRSALLSLAVGTPLVAAGRSTNLGLISGQTFRIGSWCSFGDNPVESAQAQSALRIGDLFDRKTYNMLQECGRKYIDSFHKQSRIDEQTEGILTQFVS